jgi:dTDP-4-dehydrorhamnose reductase
MKKIIFTGGSGRFGSVFKKLKTNYKIFFPSKKQLNVVKIKTVENFIKRVKPSYFIHAAAISRPMNIHEKKISESIDANIIGTANVVKICSKYKIKLIYFSTNYVYPSETGKYNEESGLKPINNYGWSKLGGESAVQMYPNSLILRICMTEKPFIHNKAFSNLKTNFMYHVDLAKVLTKLIKIRGIINIGGPTQSVYNFVKKDNPNIKKKLLKIKSKKNPLNSTMDIKKFKKFQRI